MPKQKTHSGAKKRFRKSADGHYKCDHSGHDHILTKKTTKPTRGYRQPCYVDSTNAATLKRMLPYG